MLVARLPRYMVPQRIVIVDDIPLTANGKLDEAALAAIDSAAADGVGRNRTGNGHRIRAHRACSPSILHVTQIDPDADFLRAGPGQHRGAVGGAVGPPRGIRAARHGWFWSAAAFANSPPPIDSE